MASQVLRAIRAHATQRPSSIALQGVTESVDFARLQHQVEVFARWLSARGVRRAALCGDNCPAWLMADLAAWESGAVLVPLPAFFSAEQRQHVLTHAAIEHLLVCGKPEPWMSGLDAVSTPLEGVVLARLPHAPVAAPPPPGTCKISFTSGTTGQPKGVCLSSILLDLVVQALATRIHESAGISEAVQSHFTLLPLATLLENVAGAYVPLLLGKRVIVRPAAQTGLLGSSTLDLPRLLRALEEDAPHSLILLPQILRGLVAAAESGWSPPDSLRFIAVGGATTPASVIRRARALGLPVFEGYGLTECGSVVALNAPGADRVGSVGRPLAHQRVRVVDGVIQVASECHASYLGDPEPAADDWIDTGDLGHLDEEGFLFVTGRRKNVLITGFGRNVSPEWVEAELTLDPRVAQAIVVGEARSSLAAIVCPTAGSAPNELAAAIQAANTRLPDYARVRGFIVAAEPFSPVNGQLTSNGRLCRDGIADRYAAGLAALFAAPACTTHEDAIPHVL